MCDALPEGKDRVLIFGIGNEDRGDDAAGILVARKIGARTISGNVLTILDQWKGADCVILIDAVRTGAPPGTIHTWSGIPAAFTGTTSTHGFGLAETLRMAEELGVLPPRLEIYGIEAASFELHAPVTPAVSAAIQKLAETGDRRRFFWEFLSDSSDESKSSRLSVIPMCDSSA